MKIDKFKVEKWFNKYEKDAVYDLADTCVESLSIDELLELVGGRESHINEIFSRKLNYGAIHGSERLKNAICTMYKNQSAENITITHGAIGANHLVMLTLVEPGDKVVSIVPTYQQHYSIPKSFGAGVKMFFLEEKNNPAFAFIKDLHQISERNICEKYVFMQFRGQTARRICPVHSVYLSQNRF